MNNIYNSTLKIILKRFWSKNGDSGDRTSVRLCALCNFLIGISQIVCKEFFDVYLLLTIHIRPCNMRNADGTCNAEIAVIRQAVIVVLLYIFRR